MDVLHDIEQQHVDRVVRGDDGKASVGGQRIEFRPQCNGCIDTQQDVIDSLHERLCQRRQLRFASHLDDQRVIEILAQPGQDATHGRLGNKQAFTGACDVLFRQKRPERTQEIQIELVVAHRP